MLKRLFLVILLLAVAAPAVTGLVVCRAEGVIDGD